MLRLNLKQLTLRPIYYLLRTSKVAHEVIIIHSKSVLYCCWFYLFVNFVQFAVIFFISVFVVHGQTTAIFSAHHVTLYNLIDGGSFEHVIFKSVVSNNILVDRELDTVAESWRDRLLVLNCHANH